MHDGIFFMPIGDKPFRSVKNLNDKNFTQTLQILKGHAEMICQPELALT